MATYIEKSIEDVNTGAEVRYHEIISYSVDVEHQTSTVTIKSYISLKMKEAGKQPVGNPITLSLTQAPPPAEEALLWFSKQITQAVPEGYELPPEHERYYGWINPHLLAGGKIKQSE